MIKTQTVTDSITVFQKHPRDGEIVFHALPGKSFRPAIHLGEGMYREVTLINETEFPGGDRKDYDVEVEPEKSFRIDPQSLILSLPKGTEAVFRTGDKKVEETPLESKKKLFVYFLEKRKSTENPFPLPLEKWKRVVQPKQPVKIGEGFTNGVLLPRVVFLHTLFFYPNLVNVTEKLDLARSIDGLIYEDIVNSLGLITNFTYFDRLDKSVQQHLRNALACWLYDFPRTQTTIGISKENKEEWDVNGPSFKDSNISDLKKNVNSTEKREQYAKFMHDSQEKMVRDYVSRDKAVGTEEKNSLNPEVIKDETFKVESKQEYKVLNFLEPEQQSVKFYYLSNKASSPKRNWELGMIEVKFQSPETLRLNQALAFNNMPSVQKYIKEKVQDDDDFRGATIV